MLFHLSIAKCMDFQQKIVSLVYREEQETGEDVMVGLIVIETPILRQAHLHPVPFLQLQDDPPRYVLMGAKVVVLNSGKDTLAILGQVETHLVGGARVHGSVSEEVGSLEWRCEDAYSREDIGGHQ